MKLDHRFTVLACYNGYITQAICINLMPLFYLSYQEDYGLSLGQISTLIVCNFAVQFSIDFLAAFFSKRMNVRFCTVLAHFVTAVGLFGMWLFPRLLPPYVGLLLSVSCLGVGGGFTEVMISPLIEACPTTEKSAGMSLLHSFYCWGQAGVVLITGVLFRFVDRGHWSLLPLFWTVIPLVGAIAFCVVPIYHLPSPPQNKKENRGLFASSSFWVFLLLMLCAGASEMVMSQWASGFAESALGVEKSVGDLLGPCLFALMMGLARMLYGKLGNRLHGEAVMGCCCVLCIFSYFLAAWMPHPLLAFLGCALCGFSVGIFWPGTLSRAAERIPYGGIAMFAFLALAGDLGCLCGPAAAGAVAEACGGDLRCAFVFALIFPATLLTVLLFQQRRIKTK